MADQELEGVVVVVWQVMDLGDEGGRGVEERGGGRVGGGGLRRW